METERFLKSGPPMSYPLRTVWSTRDHTVKPHGDLTLHKAATPFYYGVGAGGVGCGAGVGCGTFGCTCGCAGCWLFPNSCLITSTSPENTRLTFSRHPGLLDVACFLPRLYPT